MTTRANWFVDLDIPAEDLDDPPELIQRLAEGVDLRDPESLHGDLGHLMERENALWTGGVRCVIKQDASGSCCVACPLKRTDEEDPLTALCTVGVEQERVLTLLAIHRHARAG